MWYVVIGIIVSSGAYGALKEDGRDVNVINLLSLFLVRPFVAGEILRDFILFLSKENATTRRLYIEQ